MDEKGSEEQASGGRRRGAQNINGRDEAEQKFIVNPSMAAYGDADSFVTTKSIRAWASRLKGVSGSMFRAHEVSTAGHFWAEEGVIFTLRDAVQTFAGALVSAEEGERPHDGGPAKAA